MAALVDVMGSFIFNSDGGIIMINKLYNRPFTNYVSSNKSFVNRVYHVHTNFYVIPLSK